VPKALVRLRVYSTFIPPTRSRIISASVLTLTALIGIFSGGATFATNDGAGISAIVSGEYTGVPVGQMFFSSRIIAIPISWLYTIVPVIGWYALLQLSLVLLASILIIWQLENNQSLIAWTALLLPIIVWSAWRPDYTFTALIVSSLSVVSWSITLSTPVRHRSVLLIAITTTVMFFGASWRPAAALVGFAIFLPTWFLLFALRNKFNYGFLLIFLLPAAVVVEEGMRMLQSDSWTSWESFNKIRGELHGSSSLALLADKIDFGWSEAAVRLFQSFAYTDDPVFGYQSLLQLSQQLPSVLAAPGTNLYEIVIYGLKPLLDFWWIAIPSLLIAIGLAIASGTLNRSLALLLITTSAYWALLIVVVGLLRLPGNLLVPIVVSIGLAVALHVNLIRTSGIPNYPQLVPLGLH
jgi:hypothetical protein